MDFYKAYITSVKSGTWGLTGKGVAPSPKVSKEQFLVVPKQE